MAIFGPKPQINPLEKYQFFDFLNFLFLRVRKAFFSSRIFKRHFPGLYCRKKKVGKMTIFGPKPWLNPFEKMSIFRLFELLVFNSLKKAFFCCRISLKTFSWSILRKKKNLKKMVIFGPKPRVNPFGKKCQFFYFLNFLILQPRKAFFRSRIG